MLMVKKRYILAPNGLKVGDVVFSGPESDIKPGNCLPLINIPDGTQIHNIELKIGKGGQIVRSAGTSAQLMGKDNDSMLFFVYHLAKCVAYVKNAMQQLVLLVTLTTATK